jgi:hypothetical protein
MTEEEWLTSTSLDAMLGHLRRQCRVAQRKAGRRKLRLFACACVRRAWDLLADERSRQAVVVAERFAEGLADEEERARAEAEAREAGQQAWREWDSRPGSSTDPGARGLAAAFHAGAAAWWAVTTSFPVVGAASAAASSASQALLLRDGGDPLAQAKERSGDQCPLLREVFGNPFAPLAPRAFPANVVGLARAADGGDHSLYPLLADALEDLGEEVAAAHCREPGHVKGCHVVDLVLGKW